MIDSKIINFSKIRGYSQILENMQSERNQIAISLPRSVRLPFLASLCRDLDTPILLITSKSTRLRTMHEEFGFWSNADTHLIFAEPTPLFFEKGNWSQRTRRERMDVLSTLAKYFIPAFADQVLSPVIFTSIKAIMTRTLPRRILIKHFNTLRLGEHHAMADLMKNWLDAGYERTEIVVSPGQFSRRGGLLDIWPITDKQPIRIEFFGSEIDTMRVFDPATQRSTESIHEIHVPPAMEAVAADSSDGQQENRQSNSEFEIPLLYKTYATLLDYLPKQSLILLDNAASVEASADEIETQALKTRQENVHNGILDENYPSPYVTWSEIKDYLPRFKFIDLGYPVDMNEHLLSESFSPSPRFGGQMDDFFDFIIQKNERISKIYIISKQIDRLRELGEDRKDFDWDSQNIELIRGSISGGWRAKFSDDSISYLFSDQEIFGWKRPMPRWRKTERFDGPEFSYADMKPGDFVVHVDYGIGRFAGLVRRALGGAERDYLKIEYAQDDELFVPIHQADRLTLYIGPDARIPRLSDFGSSEWSSTKKRVQEAVEHIAWELLDLYTYRQSTEGFVYSEDTEWQKILESSFPHAETADQIQAVREVKADMESKLPMDRLLCGDVGYGKTEVALRAAFKAVMDGKQVAMLVPTTVLAQQHFDTFCSRLVPFPVKVEMLSRFRSAAEQEEILLGLEAGEIDIVIGTHRLLQPDVDIPNLGLLIIDEEQRFGVTHKEYFKHMRKEVDVLTLTATPIPRTLYMALSGIRDISVINTPPSDRMPIQTYVGGYDPDVVRRAIMREIDRGGQVFFVHNRVQTISAMSAHLQRIVPEARIGIAHGRMKEKMLAEVMHQFNAGKIDVLLSTSIIESGLDIPNANTLIVDRGDTFGLSQLYQLRGRVGRGSARAYAYLFHHRKKKPTPEGLERLETIAENSQLGAGYSIAMRDLEMRGAGELLGTQQHGYIAAVGFHLYTRLLAQAIAKLKGSDNLVKEISQTKTQLIRPLVSVDLPVDAGISKAYIPDDQVRLNIYRRMADVNTLEEVEELKTEFVDRFGPFAEDLKNLLWLLEVRILAGDCGLSAVTLEGKNIVFRFPSLPDGKDERPLPDFGGSIRAGKNAYWMPYENEINWKARLMDNLWKLKRNISGEAQK